jgi:DNA polymerase-3 subunit gamma/tau
VVKSSKDIAVFWQDLISLYRDMLVVKTTKNASQYLDLTDHESEQLRAVADRFRKETLMYHCRLLEDAFFAMQKTNAVKRIVAEMTLVRMCDEALDTSPEALLSRMAQLEEQMITGRVVRQAAPAPAAEAAAPAVKPTPATPKTSQPAAAPNAPAPVVGVQPLRNWMEVVDRVLRVSPMDAGFLKGSHAFTQENGAVVVRFESDFCMQMMDRDESRDRLRAALSAVLRREVGDRMLIMEVVGKQEKASVLDEIIGTAE